MSIGEKKFDRTYLALPKPRNLILFHVEFCLKVLEIFLRIVGGGLGSFLSCVTSFASSDNLPSSYCISDSNSRSVAELLANVPSNLTESFSALFLATSALVISSFAMPMSVLTPSTFDF